MQKNFFFLRVENFRKAQCVTRVGAKKSNLLFDHGPEIKVNDIIIHKIIFVK